MEDFSTDDISKLVDLVHDKVVDTATRWEDGGLAMRKYISSCNVLLLIWKHNKSLEENERSAEDTQSTSSDDLYLSTDSDDSTDDEDNYRYNYCEDGWTSSDESDGEDSKTDLNKENETEGKKRSHEEEEENETSACKKPCLD
ncbi:unnamed protein product [Caenorhabditis angaria]|uniref:Uncharacterized protein n=1 Tax=Caenorhabditis angaria TaxID=860376 RepID=A0A9P1J0P5_9PELO|nr:unnamed protein product [Caenorhabditis angaria]